MARAKLRALFLIAGLATIHCGGDPDPEPPKPVPTPEIFTPRWAFEPWISKDISDAQDTYQFVEGFETRDIPVGVVVIDSPWETNYNTFQPNPSRYPAFEKMVGDLHDRGIRIVLWITPLMNESSFDAEPGGDEYPDNPVEFHIAKRRNYFVNEGETYFWWKGKGGGIDFFNEDAMSWWHSLQDPLLDLPINGWKLDFGDSYIETATVVTRKGPIPHQAYSEEYYRDFWAYGVSRVGRDEFTTMVRPWDESYHFEGRFFARPEHAPVTWVGDNRRDWVGLVDALDHIFRSAQAGYVVVGSDIGGYLDRDDKHLIDVVPFDGEAFLRWTALGAMTPFMQLHGRANLSPWTVPDRVEETVSTYRYWATLHHELVPFFYSLAESAYAQGGTILHPIGNGPTEWQDDWRFLVGEAFLVAPIFTATTARDVALPSDAKWYDWWDPSRDALDGGQTLRAYDVSNSARIPMFVRDGAIIPVEVDNDVTGLGSAASAGHLTVLVYPSAAASRFDLFEEDDAVTVIAADADTSRAEIRLSRARRPTLLCVRSDTAPARATLNGTDLASVSSRDALGSAASGYFYEVGSRFVWVKISAGAGEQLVELGR